MKKDKQVPIRLDEKQRKFLDEESIRQRVSLAEVIRRMIDDAESKDAVTVRFDPTEREWITNLAENLHMSQSEMIRINLGYLRTIMSQPLLSTMKNPLELARELKRREKTELKRREKMENGGED